jgi:hypothetical protein
MASLEASLTLIGGPTVLIEFFGLRLLTDPTFDEPGTYETHSPHARARNDSVARSQVFRLGKPPASRDQADSSST